MAVNGQNAIARTNTGASGVRATFDAMHKDTGLTVVDSDLLGNCRGQIDNFRARQRVRSTEHG
jgi:hypothetical protein